MPTREQFLALHAERTFLEQKKDVIPLNALPLRTVPNDGIRGAYTKDNAGAYVAHIHRRGANGAAIRVDLTRGDVDLLHNYLVSTLLGGGTSPPAELEELKNAAYRFCCKAHEWRMAIDIAMQVAD